MKFLNFFYLCGSFLPYWNRNPDPDLLICMNPDPIRIQIRIRNTLKYQVKIFIKRRNNISLYRVHCALYCSLNNPFFPFSFAIIRG
jgi:hypothetical protein